MRLRTLPVSVAGVVSGIGFAACSGEVRWGAAALCFGVAVLAQIASNFANEYYDWANGLDRAGREGPRRGVTEGDITPNAMKMATFITLALACCAGLGLVAYGGWWLVFVGIAIAMGVYAYSAGPYPLSHHGLGEVAVIVFFGILPVNFTGWLCGGGWSMEAFCGSVTIGLLGANVLIVNNYRDESDDYAVGKRTLAVILGSRAMPWLYVANALIGIVVSWRLWSNWWLVAPIAMIIVAAFISIQMRKRQGRALTPLLGMTAVAMSIYSLVFAVSCFCGS